MSRSYRKHKFLKPSDVSNKLDRSKANRRLRRMTNQSLSTGEVDRLPVLRDVSDPWDFKSDGRAHYVGNWNGMESKWFRK